MARHLSRQQAATPVAIAGNGLLDRRLFLKGGAAFAAAITGYTLTDAAGAQALADDPWSRVAGKLVTDYGVPSRVEKKVARTIANFLPYATTLPRVGMRNRDGFIVRFPDKTPSSASLKRAMALGLTASLERVPREPRR